MIELVVLSALAVPFLLNWLGPRIPRQLAYDICQDFRFLQHEVRYPKTYTGNVQLIVWGLWIGLVLLTLSLNSEPLFALRTLILAGCLLLGALIDHHTGLLPFRVSYVLGFVGLYDQSITAPHEITGVFHSLIAIYLIGYVTNRFSLKFRGHPAIGGGDIVLMMMLTAWLPPIGLGLTLWIASVTGLIQAKLTGTGCIRLGPHLASAALSCWLIPAIL